MMKWFDKNAHLILGGLWLIFMYLLSLGAIVWVIKWIAGLVGVL